MLISLRPSRYWHAPAASIALCVALVAAPWVAPALAAACLFEPQGEGRVAVVIDARGFRLEDGREVRLAGIEPASSAMTAKDTAKNTARDRTAALAAIVPAATSHCAARTTPPTAMAGKRPLCFSRAPKPWSRACCLREARRWPPLLSATRTAPRPYSPPKSRPAGPKREPGPMRRS